MNDLLAREWIDIAESVGKANATSAFTVMQWNVLADCCCNAGEQGFPYVSETARDASSRHALQLAELQRCDADLIALEEVDEPEHFVAFLIARGYRVVYEKRQSSPLGIVIAWRETVFTCLTHERLDFETGSQMALLARLQCVRTGRQLTFAAVHLKAKAENEAIRSAQIKELLRRVIDVSEPILLVGDFNTEQDSVTYAAATQAGLKSAYRGADGAVEAFSTYKLRPNDGIARVYRRTIDYVWHSPQLKLTRRLEIPLDIPKPGLPSAAYPSDHLALCCVFALG